MANIPVPYSDAEGKLIKRLWAEGKSSREICGAIWDRFRRKRTRNGVIGFIHRNQLGPRAPQPRRMAPIGTTTERARSVTTKPKVISMPATPKKKQKTSVPAPRPKPLKGGAIPNAAFKASRAREEARAGTKRPDLKALSVDAAPVAPLNLTVLEVTDRTCRFPVSHDLPHQFCGHPVLKGKVYCGAHHAIVVAGPSEEAA